MEEPTVQSSIKNLDDLTKLLQKATDQMEQLQKTLKEIENFKFNVSSKLET